MEEITVEPVSFGYAVFKGVAKLAVLTTSHHAGLYRHGHAIVEHYPREQWMIHWTTPGMSAADAQAVLEVVAGIPEGGGKPAQQE